MEGLSAMGDLRWNDPFIEYQLKWLFKCKSLLTPGQDQLFLHLLPSTLVFFKDKASFLLIKNSAVFLAYLISRF